MDNTRIIENNIAYLPVVYLTQSIKALSQKGNMIADSDNQPIFILGERGSGKELLAKSIHCNSSPTAPFVTINCVNLPIKYFEEKIEECFDVFSDGDGTVSEECGYNKPTLFIRNIGKMEGGSQEDLFNLLKERLWGDSNNFSKIFKKMRLMFSCNKNGTESVDLKTYFTNLTDTFKPYMLSILPLRDRKSDIRPLALFYMDKFCKEYSKDIGGIHSEALKLLDSHAWPGNVSELRDVVENAILLSQTPLITKEDIRFNISKKSIALESFLSREDFFKLEELENIYIQTVLRRSKNNKSKTARILGISRNTLQRKIESCCARPIRKKSKKKNANQPMLF